MFEAITSFFKKVFKSGQAFDESSKDTAKERLHLVLMQDRANVSADFLDLMKQEIIDVIKKYIEVDEKEIDVRLTNQSNDDGTNGAPALYANIPILNIKNDAKSEKMKEQDKENIEEKVNDSSDTEKPEKKKAKSKKVKVKKEESTDIEEEEVKAQEDSDDSEKTTE